jgi:hypothetical protein
MSEESIARAEQKAKEWLEEQERKLKEKQKTLDVHVSVDSKEMERLIKEKEELESQNEDLKGKLEIISEKELEKRLQGIPENLREYFREHPEQLQGFELGRGKSESEPYSPRDRNQGSAPMNKFQMGSSAQQGFETVEEMIDDLRNRAHQGEREAEIILRKLFEKNVQGLKQGVRIQYPSTPELDPSKESSEVKTVFLGQKLDSGEESEIKKWTKRKRKPITEEERPQGRR